MYAVVAYTVRQATEYETLASSDRVRTRIAISPFMSAHGAGR